LFEGCLLEDPMKLNGLRLLSCISIVLTFFICLPVRSQQSKKPTEDVIKIGTELVQIDVLVLDKNNKPVGGLKREDFELYDNDDPQVLTHFSFEESKTRGAYDPDVSRLLPTMKPGDLNRVVAFVIDTLHMNPDSVYRTRKMLEDFIEAKMAPGDLVLILQTGGGSGLYQRFTSDRRVLLGAVSRLRPAFIMDTESPARRGGPSQQVLELLPALAEGRAGVTQVEGQGGTGTGSNVSSMLEESDVRATLNTLNTLVSGMAKLPGRKIGIFVSEGFRAFQSQRSQELSDTAARAARANVVFYSLDPNGLDPVGVTAAGAYSGISRGPVATDPLSPSGIVISSPRLDINNPATERRREYFESQDALNAIAVDTGGKFLRNSNDIKSGLGDLLAQNSSYYLLGFQPDSGKWDGKFHKIKVVVRNRPDLVVSTRKGYLARSEKPKDRGPLTQKAAEMLDAIASPLVRRDIDIQLGSFYRDNENGEPVVTSLLHIDAAKLSFKEADGKKRTKLEVTGFLLDAAGRAVKSFSKTADLNLDPQVHQALTKDGILMVQTYGVKPGAYQLKTLVRELDSGFIGTASTYVEIPDLKADQLALSSLFTDIRVLQQNKEGEITGVSSLLAQRRFPRNSECAYVLIIYNAGSEGKSKTQLEMVTRILRGGQVLFNGQPKSVEVLEGSKLPSQILTGGVVQLGGLAPGDYTLEVTVTDKLRKKEKGLARQEVDITVD
jgi:VWFA-related protein